MILHEPAPPRKRSFRVDEVMVLLGISRRTVYRMIGDGRLGGAYKTARSGGHYRIPAADLVNLTLPVEDEP